MAQEPDRLTSDADAPDPARIEREIEHTRAEMSETIDALSARFQPSYIKEQAQEAIADTARSAGTSMIDTLRDNPLPAAIAGLSIAWMIANRSPGSRPAPRGAYRRPASQAGSYDYGRTGSYGGRPYPSDGAGLYGGTTGASSDGPSLADRAGDVADHAKDLAGQARDRAADVAGQVGDRAADLGQQAQEVAGRAGSWLEDQMDQNPLGVGAVALMAGALVGLSLPSTDAETNLMGRPAANLMNQVKEVAGERIDQAKEVAGRVADEVKEKAGEIAETVKTEAKDVAETATSEVKAMADKGPSGAPSGGSAPGAGSASGGGSSTGGTPPSPSAPPSNGGSMAGGSPGGARPAGQPSPGSTSGSGSGGGSTPGTPGGSSV
jgi:ElaB/YqjD/DUF883 family membrane-anchored ribosome-binding protein